MVNVIYLRRYIHSMTRILNFDNDRPHNDVSRFFVLHIESDELLNDGSNIIKVISSFVY